MPIVVQCAVVSLPFAIDDFEDHPIDDGRTPLDKLQRKPHKAPEYGIKHSSRELIHDYQAQKQAREQSYNHQRTPKVRDQSHNHQATQQGRDHSYNHQATQPASYPSYDNEETAQEIPPYHDEEPTKVKPTYTAPTYSAPATSSYSAPSQPIGSSEGYFKGFVSNPIVLKDDASFEARFPFPAFPQ
jgi:hypothetical protein